MALLTVGVCALLLWRVLARVSAGRPFAPGQARTVAVVAVVIVLGGSLASVLSDAATLAVLSRLGLDSPAGPFEVGVTLPLLPLLLGGLVLVVAESLRSGARLQDDLDGLV